MNFSKKMTILNFDPNEEKSRQYSEEYKKRFEGYKARIDWHDSRRPINPELDDADIILTTRDGKEYWTSFVTRKYLDYLFRKNKKTGECAGGTYFAMPGMIVVERIDKDSIRKTIDDMINLLSVESYFMPYE